MNKLLPRDIGLCVLVLIVAIALRGLELETRSFGQDELALLLHQSFSIAWLLEFCLGISFHPPLYYFYLKVWTYFLGDGEIISRMSSVVPAILTCVLPFLYRSVFPKTYLIFAIVLAFSHPLIEWSRIVDPYSLGVFFFLNALLYFLKHKGSENWKNQLLAGFFAALCFYVHYAAGLAILIVYGLFFFYNFKKKILPIISYILLCLPWILFSEALRKMPTGSEMHFWNPPTGQLRQLEDVIYFLFSGSPLLLVLFSLCFMYFLINIKKNDLTHMMLLASALIFIAIVFVRSLNYHSVLVPRYFIWLVPVLYLFMLMPLKQPFQYIVGFLVLLSPQISDSKRFPPFSQDIRTSLEHMSKIASESNCVIKPVLVAFNGEWFNPYINRFSGFRNCRPQIIKNEECHNKTHVADFISILPSPSVVGFLETECKMAEKLKQISKDQGQLISYEGFHLYLTNSVTKK